MSFLLLFSAPQFLNEMISLPTRRRKHSSLVSGMKTEILLSLEMKQPIDLSGHLLTPHKGG